MLYHILQLWRCFKGFFVFFRALKYMNAENLAIFVE